MIQVLGRGNMNVTLTLNHAQKKQLQVKNKTDNFISSTRPRISDKKDKKLTLARVDEFF